MCVCVCVCVYVCVCVCVGGVEKNGWVPPFFNVIVCSGFAILKKTEL